MHRLQPDYTPDLIADRQQGNTQHPCKGNGIAPPRQRHTEGIALEPFIHQYDRNRSPQHCGPYGKLQQLTGQELEKALLVGPSTFRIPTSRTRARVEKRAMIHRPKQATNIANKAAHVNIQLKLRSDLYNS